MKMAKMLVVSAILAVVETYGFEIHVKSGDELEGARNAIREARKSGKLAPDDTAYVTFAPGIYTAKTLLLDAADHGIVWRAKKRGSVRILGGRRISMDRFAKISDPKVLNRLDPAVRDRIRVADVAAELPGEQPVWENRMQKLPGPWLYCNGEPQTIARWPNVDAPDGGMCGYTNLVEAGSKTEPGAFEFPGDRAERWNVAEGVWLYGYWKWDWHSETLRLGSYDKSKHVARMACGSTYALGKGRTYAFPTRRFYALNLLEELDSPGEWYLERKTKKLYWFPLVGADEKSEIVLAQALTPFVKAKEAKRVAFVNLGFEYSHGGTVMILSDCENCVVRSCTFANHAGAAVALFGKGNRLEDSIIRNIGATAVRISGGSRANLLPANNVMRGCTLENYAMFQRTMASGIVIDGCGNAIRENKVRNAPYISIAYSGNEHLIADNEFDHVVLEAGDSGCIYSGHNASSLGTIIFGNYIHDLAKSPSEKNCRNAVYFDDCDWGDDVIGNTFVRAGNAVLIGGGKLHGVYNNLVKDCRAGVLCDSRGQRWRNNFRGSFGWNEKGQTFCRQRMAQANVDPYFAPWSVVYPELDEAMFNRPEMPAMNEVKGNVFAECLLGAFRYDGGAQTVMGKESPGNTVLAKGAAAPDKAPQPILLSDAVDGRFESADGGTVLRVKLDDSARLSWTVVSGGRTLVPLSPLGITVGRCDYGRKTVPGRAEPVKLSAADLAEFGKVTYKVPSPWVPMVRNFTTNTAAKAGMLGWKIPIRDLVTGKTTAVLEARVWNGSAALRWRVPGEGTRVIRGENTCFLKGDDPEVSVLEWARPKDYPESLSVPRGKSATGVVFPEYPRGWKHEGEVISPWRGVGRVSMPPKK